jgi:hypothetical protein
MAELKWWVRLELFSKGLWQEPVKPQDHDLGFAIFVVAIEDYCSPDEEIHADARDFLFPPTAEWRNHFDWAVSLADGLNPGWLRSSLDRFRSSWDEQRAIRSARKPRRHRLQIGRNANERKANVEREQAAVAVRSDGVVV